MVFVPSEEAGCCVC